jgi:hypothetical protein
MRVLRVVCFGVLGVLVVCVVCGVGAVSARAAASAAVSQQASTVAGNVVPWMTNQLSQYAGAEDGPFVGGVWTDTASDAGCWACEQGGPATAAATLYVLGGESNSIYLSEAEQTINTAIAQQQTPDGGFTPPAGDGQPEDIASMFFGVEFGTTYHLLAPYLSAQTKAAWQASLADLGNYMINSGTATFYSNGNINLGITELFWLIWQATGQTQYQTDYNNSWAFTMSPPHNKFPGCGWIVTHAPTQADGSDGSGYFAETGTGGTGYDPEYSMLQLDVAARLWLMSGDPRALKVANMLVNQELPLVNTSTWMLDTSNGTRHTQSGRYVGFQTAAFAVLGLDAGRSDLLQYIQPELTQDETWYPQPGQANSAVFRRAFGNSISVLALAAANTDPQLNGDVAGLNLATTSGSASPAPVDVATGVTGTATGTGATPPTTTSSGATTSPTNGRTSGVPAGVSATPPPRVVSGAVAAKAAPPRTATSTLPSRKNRRTLTKRRRALSRHRHVWRRRHHRRRRRP